MDDGDLQARYGRVLTRLRSAFETRDYRAFVESLTEAAEVRRELASGPDVARTWQRVRTDAAQALRAAAAFLDSLAAKLPPDLPLAGELAAATATAGEAARALEGLGDDLSAVPDAQAVLGRAETTLHDLVEDVLRHDAHLLDGPRRAARAGLLDLTADPQVIAARETAWEAGLTGGPEEVGLIRAVTVAAVLTTDAALRAGRYRALLDELDLPAAARRWRDLNIKTLSELDRFLENWRGRLEGDWARIEALDGARTAHAAFVTALYDLEAFPEAFAAAEMARARASADLLAGDRRTARALTPVRLREALRGRAVVEYFLAGDRLLIFCLRPDGGIETADRPLDRAALKAAIGRLHHLVAAPDVDDEGLAELTGLTRTLGRMLWDPVPWLPDDPAQPVLLVPHEELLRVPFAALRAADGRPVAERHPVSVLMAAAILPGLPDRPRGPDGPSLYALVAPEPMPDPGRPPLSRLARRFPGIAARYPGPVRVRYGAEATAAALREVPRLRPEVLCLATHGVARADRPMESYVALAGERLYARQVADLDLPARLVVLAACETGAGRVSADGVIGLTRAFLLAGPRAVLMTLWPVAERDTLAVLNRFHDHYLGGASPAAALRAAQADLARLYPDDPRRWAAYLLFGSPD